MLSFLLLGSVYPSMALEAGDDSGLTKEQKIEKQVERLREIQEEKKKLSEYKSYISDMADSAVEFGALSAQYEKERSVSSEDAKTLKERIALIQEEKHGLESSISAIDQQVVLVQENISDIQEVIDQENIKLQKQKTVLEQIMRHLYGQGNLSIVEVLLKNNTFGEALRETKNFTLLEHEAQKVFRLIRETERVLQDHRDQLATKEKQLVMYIGELEEEKQELEEVIEGERKLLAITYGKEAKYTQLLVQAKRAQKELKEEMESMEISFDQLKQQLDSEQAKLLSKKSFQAEDLQFIWPVSANRGLTAYFHQQSYRARWGFTHNAIDIKAYQGTQVVAPSYGYVYAVKDNGYGYSSLVIAHSNRVFTVYGHMSGFNVKEGDIVQQGDLVGWSGGMPGTRGAGPYTTGPHMHFELWEDGKPVDPLTHMDLTQLPIEYVPGKYLPKLAEQLNL
ncbi:MAG: peptidoglycan DD-metalloendopeptidase family protein [Patescibacteria group bacterium]|nr:peptidoglycan DD-metalloendopeptidase family protein [Patescibacteria group bacterium]